MAKRFTDSSKWNEMFLRSLKTPYKLLWLYLWDECDHAGIWNIDFQIACIKIGEKVNYGDAIKNIGHKIIVFDSDQKLFIPDFVDFQYGALNPENRTHFSVINILRKYGLIDNANKPLPSSLQGAKDKDKDKDKDKESENSKKSIPKIAYPFSEKFGPVWQKWIDYKNDQHKFRYKKPSSELTGIKLLFEMAGQNEKKAELIIDQSIGNGWKGFVELKSNPGQPSQKEDDSMRDDFYSQQL